MPVGVILATYGEPAINSFAQQWMYSYRILKGLTRKIAKIPAPLLPVIATARARGRVKLWKENAFLSPLEKLHRETVSAVRGELARRGLEGETLVIPAYEFRRPSLTDAIRQLDQAGCERAIVVPMYIGAGDFTHAMTQFAVDEVATAMPKWKGRITLASMTATPAGAAALGGVLAAWFFDALRARGIKDLGPDWAVMLAAHGTVVNPPAGVDNGLAHFQEVLAHIQPAIAPRVGAVSVGWLNHTRGGEWTKPAVPDALAELRARGFRKLVYFPWGFTTDNAETGLEGRIALRDMADPFEHVEYLECLNAYPGLVGILADVIEEAAGLKAATPASRLSAGTTAGSMNGSHARGGAARIKA
jgi:ferrochelatase